ncbi:MAG: CAP domain-containing protein [Bacteroidota bacterium]
MRRLILKYSILFIVAILPYTAFSQKQYKPVTIPWQQWDTITLNKANTAKNDTNTTAEEKRVIQLINLCRLNAKLFAETYVTHYLDSISFKENKYSTSLKGDLKRLKLPLPVLELDEELRLFAEAHAEFSGEKGKEGPGNFEARKALLPKKYTQNSFAENRQYGDTNTIDIVMALLLDDEVESLEHRKNILNPKFNKIGLAIRPHKKEFSNCVIDFSEIVTRKPIAVAWNKWDSVTVNKAKTADTADYMTQEEKDIVMLINLCRLKPQLFLETYVTYYLDSAQIKETKWTRSLKQDIKRMKYAYPVLNVEEEIYNMAKDHAVAMGLKGKTGNGKWEKRTEELPRDKFGKFELGENIQYGDSNPLNIVMYLLIDEGSTTMQHRKNIFNPKFKFIGAAIEPHKKTEYNSVIDFAN